MKSNLFWLLGILGCLCLAANVEAAETQAVRSRQSLQDSHSRSVVAQILDSPGSGVPDDNSLILESPGSLSSNPDLESSIAQTYDSVDQNNSRRQTAINEAKQRNDQRIAQGTANIERYQQSQNSPSPDSSDQGQASQPEKPDEERTATSRRQPSVRQAQASPSRQRAASPQPDSRQTEEPPVTQAPTQDSTEPVTIEISNLDNITFQCGESDGTPATIAAIQDQDNVPIILWSSTFFETVGYNPQIRCQQVSSRLEGYRKNSSFLYFTFGKINQESVLCVTNQNGGGCGDGISEYQGLLFTLKPDADPQKTLEVLTTILQSDNMAEQKPLEE